MARLIDRMAEAAQGKPVSLKCRIGVCESHEEALSPDFASLRSFVKRVTSSGSSTKLVVHARSAVLKGFSPSDNREVPPLRYDFVTQLAEEFPNLDIVLNGGIASSLDVNDLKSIDTNLAGVMAGRWCLRSPLDLLQLRNTSTTPISVLKTYMDYSLEELLGVSKEEVADLVMPIALIFISIERQINLALDEDDPNGRELPLDELLSLAWTIIEMSAGLLDTIDQRNSTAQLRPGNRTDVPLKQFRNLLCKICGKKLMSKMKRNITERIR